MMKGRLRVLPWAATVALCALAIPATASASGMSWVSNSAPVGANKSCASPGFSSVQAALEAAPSGSKINVCGGTYVEQVQVTKPAKIVLASGSGTAKLVMPSTPSESTTSCDTAVPGGQTDEISVCTTGKVAIKGLTIEALAPIATCLGALNGINVGGGAELNASADTIIGASTTLDADKGCQKGIAVLIGSHKATVVGHAILKNDTISAYEKNGPTVVGAGSTMKMINTTVTGEGPSPWIAQNGVEVAFGGQGMVKGSTISGNGANSRDLQLHRPGKPGRRGALLPGGSGLRRERLGHLGQRSRRYYSSGSATEPSSSQVKISENTLSDNRYEGILLEEGKANITLDTITGGGELGIAILQASFQESPSESSANKSTIEGMSVAAVGVLTEGAGPAGTFTIKNSSISKNAAEVSNTSPNFTVVKKNDS